MDVSRLYKFGHPLTHPQTERLKTGSAIYNSLELQSRKYTVKERLKTGSANGNANGYAFIPNNIAPILCQSVRTLAFDYDSGYQIRVRNPQVSLKVSFQSYMGPLFG